MGENAHTETTQGFNEMTEAYSYAEQVLNEVAAVIRDGAVADNAVVRIWRDDKSFKLINSCTKGCD